VTAGKFGIIATLGITLAATFAADGMPVVDPSSLPSERETTTAPRMMIKRDASAVSLTGQISSVAHEVILRDVLSQRDSRMTVTIDLNGADRTPPGWALVTELALRAALWTQFSETLVTGEEISIRGITADPASWTTALAMLKKSLLPGMRLKTQVIEVAPVDFEGLCLRQFKAVLKNRKIEFGAGAAAIDSSAQSLLDSLIETAVDCPKAIIFVHANGDGPASVAGNRLLGKARAQSIVDYMTGRGVYPARLQMLPAESQSGEHPRQAFFAVSFALSAVRTAHNAPAGRTATH
jgi:hypothetical protein